MEDTSSFALSHTGQQKRELLSYKEREKLLPASILPVLSTAIAIGLFSV